MLEIQYCAISHRHDSPNFWMPQMQEEHDLLHVPHVLDHGLFVAPHGLQQILQACFEAVLALFENPTGIANMITVCADVVMNTDLCIVKFRLQKSELINNNSCIVPPNRDACSGKAMGAR
jgi:hypothetical protein